MLCWEKGVCIIQVKWGPELLSCPHACLSKKDQQGPAVSPNVIVSLPVGVQLGEEKYYFH